MSHSQSERSQVFALFLHWTWSPTTWNLYLTSSPTQSSPCSIAAHLRHSEIDLKSMNHLIWLIWYDSYCMNHIIWVMNSYATFILFASIIKFVNHGQSKSICHWSITQMKAVASISPVTSEKMSFEVIWGHSFLSNLGSNCGL